MNVFINWITTMVLDAWGSLHLKIRVWGGVFENIRDYSESQNYTTQTILIVNSL